MSVYTRVSEEKIIQLLQLYDVGTLIHFTGISAGMENTNYALDTTEGSFILTLYEYYSAEELPFFLDLMTHLSAERVKTTVPVSDKNGQILQSLCGKPAALIERLSGYALATTDVTVAHCEIIGDALAYFHLAGMSYPQRRTHDREYNLSEAWMDKLLPVLSAQEQQLLQQEMQTQKNIDWSVLPAGIIHADLFCDNSIFYHDVNNEPVLSGIIDLYLSCNDAFIYDLAIVANDWCCRTDGSLDKERCLALLQAYHQVRPITEEEKQAWVSMLRLGALRFWVSRLDIFFFPPEGDMVMQKDPNELKDKLLACVRDEQEISQLIQNL